MGLKSPEGGLVAIITSNGNGQRLKFAYSEDEGRTWQKYDKVADWSQDPLQNQDFVTHWDVTNGLWSLQAYLTPYSSQRLQELASGNDL